MKRFLIFIIWILIVSNFLFGWAIWHIYSGGKMFSDSTSQLLIKIASAPSEFYHILTKSESTKIKENQFSDGLKFNNLKIQNHNLEYILLSAFNKNNNLCEIQLINLSSNKIIKSWQPNFDQLDLEKISKSNTRIIHPLFYNGDIICNINNHIVRLHKETGKLIWQSAPLFHHSNEIDGNKSLWACGTLPNKILNQSVENQIIDDAIFKINPENGKILYKKSIYSILTENGYEHLFFLFGITEKDIIHVNDIQPALSGGKFWKKGDLLISCRNLSTVFIYRPSTNKIVWLKSGPWLNQHDCDFLNNHQIGIFGNDIVRVFHKILLKNNHNNQYIYDFETDTVSTPYTKMFKEAKIRTLTEGRSRILPNGELFVEETNNGRILFGNEKGFYATLVNRLDNEHISLLGWSRYYTKDELEKATNQKF